MLTKDTMAIDTESDPRSTTRWINKMTQPAPIKGHKLQREPNNKSYWCECGFYCGGLDHRAQVKIETPAEIAQHSRMMYGLHLRRIHNGGLR